MKMVIETENGKFRLAPLATCEEASPLSHREYIPCGQPAVCIVKTRDVSPYAMCAMCGRHNVRNRGAEYLMKPKVTP